MSPIQKVLSLLLGAAAPAAKWDWGMRQPLTAEAIQNMGDNSLFTRWRPYSHFLAPAGWMNDPCGPMYDPVGDLYHFHYQWHPHHVDWGNCSWGHAVSSDMVTWFDVDHNPDNKLQAWEAADAISIGPTNILSDHHDPPLFENLGILSGSATSVNLTGQVDGTLLAFYTGVSYLPTKWDKYYAPGTEAQGFALSYDGGGTWERYPDNPILSKPPGDWEIVSWRDPSIQAYPDLDILLNQSEPHFYTIFGSGIKGVGPRIPLYSAPARDLTKWTFLGALWEPAGQTSLGNVKETGSWGWNFEIPNLYIQDGHWYVSMGIEGSEVHQRNLWNEGLVSARPNGERSIRADCWRRDRLGNFVTSFNDTKNQRRIEIGWANDEMNGLGLSQQGFQGAFSLPREVSPLTVRGVSYDPSSSDPRPGSSVFTSNCDGSWNARTLGILPPMDVIRGLRRGSRYRHIVPDGTKLVEAADGLNRSFELRFTVKATTGRAGITVAASPDGSEYTDIFYNANHHTIVVDRSHSSLIPHFAKEPYYGHFLPYRLFDSGEVETLHFDIFVDGSMLEVFVNERFALTARIYPSREDSNLIGLFVGEEYTDAEFGNVEVWDGLVNAWPERPLNSSSVLVWDTPEETGNYTWWSGH